MRVRERESVSLKENSLEQEQTEAYSQPSDPPRRDNPGRSQSRSPRRERYTGRCAASSSFHRLLTVRSQVQ
ncbi:unnamed protein product [Sphagnum balticum]